MAKLNLNFQKPKDYFKLTKHEIAQIEGLALSVEAIIKTLYAYSYAENEDINDVCMGVCNALELLIEPVIGYLGDSAGSEAAPEPPAAGPS